MSASKKSKTIDYRDLVREAWEWPTINEIAEEYSLPATWVRHWLEERRITGMRLGNAYRIDPASMDRYLASRHAVGRY